MRKITIALVIVAAAIGALNSSASAREQHTSCKDFGQHNASEAQQQIIDDEVRFFGPGNVDDVVALVHNGGTFDGETIPALCSPR